MRFVAVSVALRSRDRDKCLVWNAVLPQKEVHLGGVFLDVAHSVQEQLQEADGLPP